jgi:methylenetetrahydrofolate dehydrogenase (NADP+)/methenyltetrahydrofolate cyclohydrolase
MHLINLSGVAWRGRDGDGVLPINIVLPRIGQNAPAPCTPLGCVTLAKSVHTDLKDLEVGVAGLSNVIGHPAAQLFLSESGSVTIVHSTPPA